MARVVVLQRSSNWQVVLSLFFITSVVESMSMSHVFAFMPVYLEGMHITHIETWVGILSAITFVVGFPLVPVWGIWAQRFGAKAVIIRSAYVEMVVFIVLGLSHTLLWVFIAMMMVGFQLGNTGIMLASIRQVAPDNRVGFSVSLFSIASSIGMAGGPLLGGLFTGLQWLNLHDLYMLDGFLSFATGTMLLLFYHPSGPSLALNEKQAIQHESAWTAAWKSVRFTFTLSITWILFSLYTVLMMGRQMITPYLPIVIEHLPRQFVSPTFSIGGLMGFAAMIAAFMTVIAGRLGDKIGFLRILTIAMSLCVPSILLLVLIRQTIWFTLILAIFNAGYSIGAAMLFALFSTRIPASHRATALNLIYLPLYLGGIIGPATASILTKFGLIGPFIGAGILFILGLILILVFLNTLRSRSKNSISQ